MKDKQIYITRPDLNRLRELIKNMSSGQNAARPPFEDLGYGRSYNNNSAGAELPRIEELEAELNRAVVVDADKIPPDIVTMNSEVCLTDLDTGEDETYSIVYPEDADIEQNKISVLAPIGTAILGYKLGDAVEWEVPAGTRRLKIKKILYQPEAKGDYYL